MARARYALGSVEALREQARDAAEAALETARSRTAAAEHALEQARAALERVERARGGATAAVDATATQTDGATLRREGRYAARLQDERARAQDGVRDAQRAATRERLAFAAAQDALGAAEAAREVLARDHARHDANVRRDAALADELETEEALAARPRRTGR